MENNDNGDNKNIYCPAPADRERKINIILVSAAIFALIFVLYIFLRHKRVMTRLENNNTIYTESYLSRDVLRDLDNRYYMYSYINKLNNIQTDMENVIITNEALQKEIIDDKKNIEKSRKQKTVETDMNSIPDIITH